MTSPMGEVLRTIGGGHVFVMLREAEVGYQMVRDPANPAQILGPAIGMQKIVFDATSYRELTAKDSGRDIWEFVIMVEEISPAGPIRSRNLIYVEGADILFVRAPSQLAG